MPGPERIKILVTGFGPFPGVRSNPCEKLLGWIEGQHIQLMPRVQIKTVVIPTSWDAVSQFTSKTLANLDPDIALHFGVHSRANSLRVEKLARNCTSTQADVFGEVASHHCVIERAPQILKSMIETDRIVTALRTHGLPAQSSMNAGRYLCNALLFASLFQAEKRASPRQTGFIHIPPPNARGWDKNALLKCTEIAIGHCVSKHIHETLMHAGAGG